MKKLSEKSRRILRMIYRGLGAVTVSLLFQSCYGNPLYYGSLGGAYGMPPDDDFDTIYGVVRSKTEAPVPGIKVSVKDTPSYGYAYTNTNGIFKIYVPQQESYKIKFEDIDGAENGSFKTLKKKITLGDTGVSLDIQLEEEIAE
jgi:putative lipoprotein (rSAM/lipoprotein system)